MARNLRKFVNPLFIKTIDLPLFRRFLSRHRSDLKSLDFAVFEGDREETRDTLLGFFAGAEDAYPPSLVADLHRIAEVGNSTGLRLILEQAKRLGVAVVARKKKDGSEQRHDPKHVALRMFLDHPQVFDAASDMMALISRTSLAEFAGDEEGAPAQLDDGTKQAFEKRAAAIFKEDLQSDYCRVGWYDDDDEVNLVVAHGAAFQTTEIVDGSTPRVISFQPTDYAVFSYSPATGRLKIGGVAKARLEDMAELFGEVILGKEDFFAGNDARNLYTLEPIEREGFGFTFKHAHDPSFERIQITEAQINRVGTDPKSGQERIICSYVARDSYGNALARLGEVLKFVKMGEEWRLNHVVIRAHIKAGRPKPSKVTAKIKPPHAASFKRQRFEEQIMTMLRRNGLARDGKPDQAAAAAQ